VSFVFPPVDPEPLWILGLLGIMLLAVEGGYRVGRARATRTAEGAKAHVNVVVAAMLGLAERSSSASRCRWRSRASTGVDSSC
jgi:hypothetical protein